MHRDWPHFRQQKDGAAFDAVFFDFQGTLATVEPLVRAVSLASESCGEAIEPLRAMVLADAIGAQGWVGSGSPPRVRPHFAGAWSDRDLDADSHRMAYTELAGQAHGVSEDLAQALYDRLASPEGWVAFADAASTLMTLKAQGFPIALVSNVGFDVRPIATRLGLDRFVDEWVLSYEVGYCKPDEKIFYAACHQLGVDPKRVLMVGDSVADAGAVRIGARAYLLGEADPGGIVGLGAVLKLVRADG
ncbi:HAD family hydrolase [Salininema proteolyticum]|uniref:HAD family hydrolase n=1 Tax=Salininema proteolyticum TaxID=1607685 RepID=A0ABV8U489_9ACTN